MSGLATYLWLPDGPTRAVLVIRTPYGAAEHLAEAQGWTSHGVGLVVQDVRGRHESPGEFHPYAEGGAADGPDLLTWVRSRVDAPVILWGTSYGAHAAVATAVQTPPDAVVVAVPALGLGETARTRGGVLQLASRLGWWLANDVRRPWQDVVTARREDEARSAAVGSLACPLLAIGGTDDHFAHDTVDLWRSWGGPAQLVLGPWGHGLLGAKRAHRVLAWLDRMLAGAAPSGALTVDRAGACHDAPPQLATLHLDLPVDAEVAGSWCASLRARGRDGRLTEIAHGAAFGGRITLGPVILTGPERAALECRVRADDFPRYARSPVLHRNLPDHHLELTG